MEKQKNSLFQQIDYVVFLPAFIIMIGTLIAAAVAYDKFLLVLVNMYQWATDTFGWVYVLITLAMLACCILFVVHPIGAMRFGGPDAKPDMSTFTWFSVTLTTSIGIALIMWGTVEPILHFTNPPAWAGVTPGTEEAATWALSQSMMEWSWNQYGTFCFGGVMSAYMFYNCKKPLNVASQCYYAIGDNKLIGRIFDALCLLVIVGAVATSLGIGLTQISTGLYYAFGIQESMFLKLIICVVVAVAYIAASVSGVEKGIAFVSNTNMYVFIFLLIFVFFAGPTLFDLKLGVQSTGLMLSDELERTMMMNPMTDASWTNNWPINNMISIVVYVPLFGTFFARLARGRTIRQFVGMTLGVASLFNMLWFWVFGASAIHAQVNGIVDIAAEMNAHGVQAAAFAYFQTLPLGKIIVPIFTLAVFLSFVTMAESLCTSMSAASMKDSGEGEPSKILKIVWGVFCAALAYALLGLAGPDVIKYTYMVFGFPIFIILIIEIYCALKIMFFPDFSLKKARAASKAAKAEAAK